MPLIQLYFTFFTVEDESNHWEKRQRLAWYSIDITNLFIYLGAWGSGGRWFKSSRPDQKIPHSFNELAAHTTGGFLFQEDCRS